MRAETLSVYLCPFYVLTPKWNERAGLAYRRFEPSILLSSHPAAGPYQPRRLIGVAIVAGFEALLSPPRPPISARRGGIWRGQHPAQVLNVLSPFLCQCLGHCCAFFSIRKLLFQCLNLAM